MCAPLSSSFENKFWNLVSRYTKPLLSDYWSHFYTNVIKLQAAKEVYNTFHQVNTTLNAAPTFSSACRPGFSCASARSLSQQGSQHNNRSLNLHFFIVCFYLIKLWTLITFVCTHIFLTHIDATYVYDIHLQNGTQITPPYLLMENDSVLT